jgi:hypothetical protein
VAVLSTFAVTCAFTFREVRFMAAIAKLSSNAAKRNSILMAG